MTDKLNALLASLKAQPPDRPLVDLNDAVLAEIADAGPTPAALIWSLRVALAFGIASIGLAVSLSAPAIATPSPFEAWSVTAPSSLLADAK